MTESRTMYRRLHGYMCILLLMQEFHLVMLSNVNHVYSNLEHLSVKLTTQKEGLKSKVDGYITDCSVDYLYEIEDVGHINTIQGMITRLMMALLYTVAGCGPAARELIQNLIDNVDMDTLNEVIDVMYETVEDVERAESHQTEGVGEANEDDEDDLDETSSDEEDTFMSGLLVENILNSAEMLKLFETLAEGNEFENTTDVDDIVAGQEEFSLEEILERPNYKWVAYPSANDTNITNVGGTSVDSLVNRLNSNATDRLIRDLTVSLEVDDKTRLLILYDKISYLILGVNEDNLLTLTEYDETNIQQQLWVLDDGEVINVGSHLALITPHITNGSTQVVLGKPRGSRRWHYFGGYIVSSFNSDCFLDFGYFQNNSNYSHHLGSVWAKYNCQPNDEVINANVIYFTDAQTPERLIQYAEKPLSFLKSLLQKVSNTKFMIFVSLLQFMIKTSMPGYVKNRIEGPQKIRLENTFFIKNTLKPCKVLGGFIENGTSYVKFDDFSEKTLEYQLWYWKQNQLINVGTGRSLEISKVKNEFGKLTDYDNKYNRLWTHENEKLFTFRNESCQLVYNEEYDIIILDCSDINSLDVWSFVEFNNPNFFIDVVCLYAIQTMIWPCEYLTISENSPYPYVNPFMDNVFSQLWYISKGLIINADSGFALTEINDSQSIGLGNLGQIGLTTWSIRSNQIFSSKSDDMLLTLEPSKNGTVKLHRYLNIQTQLWKLVSLDSLANESHTCDNVMDTLTPFVIRNKAIPGCKLLTVVEVNETFTLQMKHFDEENLDFHIWINYEGSLINVASGLSIQPKIVKEIILYNNVFPGQLHAFQQSEKWKTDDTNMIRWNINTNCFLDYISDSIVLNCNERETFAAEWIFTELPAQEDDLIDTFTYMCFYFIKSKDEPCQFLTADPISGNTHLRPLTQDLLLNQLWYWNDRIITLAKTGQYLGVRNVVKNNIQPWLTLINPDETSNLTTWTFSEEHLFLQLTGDHASVDYENDGKLFLTESDDDEPLQLMFVDYNTFSQDDTDSSCSIPLDENTQLFFIRSRTNECQVLKGTEIGTQPTFELFDQDDIESQLWFYEQHHIINLKTYLVLHANVDSLVAGSDIVMQQYFKYAVQQSWTVGLDMIFYAGSEYCIMDVDVTRNTPMVWCTINGGDSQRWDIIHFDDDSEYVQQLTCLFFFRHESVPCDLLTHIIGSSVLLRPVTESFIRGQVWYWSGNHVINAATGLALDFSTSTKEVHINSKNILKSTQKWIKNDMFIVSESYNNLAIGIDRGSGKVKLLDIRYRINRDDIKWTLIDYNAGVDNPSLLSCEADLTNPTVYFIRSEEDPCYVLTERDEGQITVMKAGKENVNQAWVRLRKHIVNAISGKALSVDRFATGEPVICAHRYEHEIKQHWRSDGSAVRMSSDGITKFLDVYNDVCIYGQDGTKQQEWVWLNVNDVKDNDKLLRCSKCYNKGEEKAYEVISYIPIFGWLYSAIRAPIYASKGCDGVAIETLKDFAIGIALDIGVALVTVLTLGTGSAAALGVKTAVQGGIKLGMKAAMKAITSSIKLAVKQAINAGKVLLKQGIKKSVISVTKKGFSSIKNIVKTNLKVMKHLPSSTKNFAVNSAKSIKKISIKSFYSVRSSTFGSFKSSVANGLRKLPSALMKKLKKIGNGLADRAQRKINKLDDLKKNAPTGKVRCKRGANVCNVPKKGAGKKKDANIVKSSAFVPSPTEEVSKGFHDLLRIARKNTNVDGLQNAHFGLSRKKLHSKDVIKMDKDSIHSKVLTDVNEYPYDADYNRIIKNTKGDKVPQSHTEQALLDDIDYAIKKRCGGQNCELYLWTKNSPCMKNTYKFKDNTVGNAKSCFAMLIEHCHNHVKNTPGFQMCHIGFKDFYGLDKKGTDMRKEFMQELGALTETMKNLAGKPNRYPTLTSESLDNIGSFIKFYQIS